MELATYISTLWRYKWLIVVTTVVAIIFAAIATSFLPRQYRATATLRIATTTQGGGSWGDTVYATRLMNTYEEILTSQTTQNSLISTFDLVDTPTIAVEILSNTELFQISVEYTDPLVAAEAANYLANQMVSQTQAVREFRGNPASVVEEATVPLRPSSPNLPLNLVLAVAAGLVGGLGLAFVLNNLDDTLYSSREIQQRVDVPLLGRVPYQKSPKKNKNGVLLPEQSAVAEALRHVRTHLRNVYPAEAYPVLALTSAEVREGKSFCAANLAQVLAQGGEKVLLLEVDLRRPTLAGYLGGLTTGPGLAELLAGQEGDNTAVAQTIATYPTNGVLDFIPAGGKISQPTELLGNGRLPQLLAQWQTAYDRILLDTPPCLPVTDTAVVAPYSNGIILIVRRNHSQNKSLQEAIAQLQLTPAPVLGLIINEAESRRRDFAYYG
jgi:polysaccharide biosynthesis transport protein